MTRLPVITAFGGYNAAGRSSFHQAYKRTIFESLPKAEQRELSTHLGSLMGLVKYEAGHYCWADGRALSNADYTTLQTQVEQGTLVRRIGKEHFDVDAVPVGAPFSLAGSAALPNIITMAKRSVPAPLPEGWRIVAEEGRMVTVEVLSGVSAVAHSTAVMPVQAAGQLPEGFDPGAHYRSTHHPRALQLGVMAASDAVNSLGIAWSQVLGKVRPDEIAVYSASVMSQLDGNGLGGLLKARNHGSRVTSKQLALGLNTMPADFVNAYVLGSVGATGAITGACATFLYNLNAAVDDIRSGRRRVVMVGSAEAPILPEVIDGYSAMSALATDEEIARLQGGMTADGTVNHRRASRPFGENCGFTVAESGQYVMLMDDALAIELGASIYGAVPGVFVHADGYKKSISAPGPGNYLTMGRAVALAQQLLGDEAIRHGSFVQAHGSSTPHNRTTESRIFDEVARHFGIEHWPVGAIKSYVGHSLGPASGDQLMNSLGVFNRGILPGIKTIDEVASDVHAERLAINSSDTELGAEGARIAFLNSKGFGGNNATATVIAPSVVNTWLQKRVGAAAWARYEDKRQQTEQAAQAYCDSANRGELNAIYSFGEHLIDEEAIKFNADSITVPGFEHDVPLKSDTGYDDLIS